MVEAKSSAIQTTAAAMRHDVLTIGEDGQFLGSESDLLARYGISRPTLRQASRILEHEQLISVRRGVNGGFFTRLPTSEAVTRVASIFLQTKGTDINELFRTVTVVVPALAEMACAAPVTDRQDYYAWVVEGHAKAPTLSRRAFVQHVAEHGRRLGELAECPPLALFQNVLMELTVAESKVNVFANRERIALVSYSQLELAESILAGDAQRAGQLARANEQRTADWIADAPAI
jgi:GntR family transcriptional regulator, transcriptional repressor for pyruvate dehydrogenase complex